MRVKIPSLEVRARVATLICRGFGWMLIALANLLIGVGAIIPRDRLGPIVGGVAALMFGIAFLVAKTITAEQLASGVGDL